MTNIQRRITTDKKNVIVIYPTCKNNEINNVKCCLLRAAYRIINKIFEIVYYIDTTSK